MSKHDGRQIKFEVVFEGRVQLADPLPEDRIDGVWTLSSQVRTLPARSPAPSIDGC